MTWKYDLKVAVDEASATRGEEKYNLGGYAIPIKCRGKVDPNNCLPDLGGLLAAAGEKMVEDKFKDFLNKKLGVGDKQPAQPGAKTGSTTTQQQTTQQPPAQQQQTKPADPADSIKDKVDEGLGDLLKKLPGF
jgi:hypothetical protein